MSEPIDLAAMVREASTGTPPSSWDDVPLPQVLALHAALVRFRGELADRLDLVSRRSAQSSWGVEQQRRFQESASELRMALTEFDRAVRLSQEP